MGGRREVSIIFYRPVTRSDLKQERSFFRGSVSSFLQLVVSISRKLVHAPRFYPFFPEKWQRKSGHEIFYSKEML